MDIPEKIWNRMNEIEKDNYLILLSNGSGRMIDEFEIKMWKKYHK